MHPKQTILRLVLQQEVDAGSRAGHNHHSQDLANKVDRLKAVVQDTHMTYHDLYYLFLEE